MADIRPLAPSEVDVVGAALGLARLRQGDGFYLVAWETDEPVGHLHLALSDPPELQDVQVRAERRRRGVATALIGRAEDEARARGFDRIILFVGVENVAAQKLYQRCGYRDRGDAPRRVQVTFEARRGPIEVDDTIVTWEKDLRADAS
jgi:ribosomal protein S18 acetylase RimI-like enzyme